MMSFTAAYSQQQTFSFQSNGNQVSVHSGTPVKHKQIDKSVMECTYNYSYLTDTTNVASAVNDIMLLQISSGMSKFSSYRAMQIDSLISVSATDQIQANPDKYAGGETFSVYKNYPAGKFTNIDRVSTDWFMYEEDIPVQEWTLFDDSVKDISGYKCSRAECDFRGRKYIAWYSGEIAVADGPWKFGGLPGLIMEVADSKGHYSFTLEGINSQASRDITIPDVQYNKASREKFYIAKRKFDIDPIGYLAALTGVNLVITNPDGTPNDKAMQQRELKYDYIERDYNK
jgi:GLPGLI family protein